MSIRFTHLAGVAIAATLATVGTASAREKHLHHPRVASNHRVLIAEVKAPPLTVQKRSFLDPGNVVPVGSATPESVTANTTENRQIYTSYAPAKFGESTLPGPYYLPGDPRFSGGNTIDWDDLIP